MVVLLGGCDCVPVVLLFDWSGGVCVVVLVLASGGVCVVVVVVVVVLFD